MGEAPMKILHGFCRAGGDGIVDEASSSVFASSLALLVLVDVSRRKPRLDVWIGTMAVSSTSLCYREHSVWSHGLVPRYSPPVFTAVLV